MYIHAETDADRSNFPRKYFRQQLNEWARASRRVKSFLRIIMHLGASENWTFLCTFAFRVVIGQILRIRGRRYIYIVSDLRTRIYIYVPTTNSAIYTYTYIYTSWKWTNEPTNVADTSKWITELLLLLVRGTLRDLCWFTLNYFVPYIHVYVAERVCARNVFISASTAAFFFFFFVSWLVLIVGIPQPSAQSYSETSKNSIPVSCALETI